MKKEIESKKLFAYVVLLVITAMVLVVSSCGGGGGGDSQPDVILPDETPPAVVSTSPTAGATGVAVNGTLSITFSEAMNPATLTPAAIRLESADGTPVPGTISYSGLTVVFTPASPLAFSSSYTLVVSTAVKDLVGHPLVGVYSCTFITGTAPDFTPPTVISTVPAAGAANVAVDSSISVTFSEAMDPATVNVSTFTLKDGGNNPVSGTVTYFGTTATFSPNADLGFATVYTATITSGARDLAGNSQSGFYSWTLSTAASATFTVNITGTGSGTVTSTPAGINCGADCAENFGNGTEVILAATPGAGSVFEGFSGGCNSIEPACASTLMGDETVNAIFNKYFESAAGNQLGLDGGDQVAVHQWSYNPLVSPLDMSTFTIEAWIYPLADRNMIVVADSAYYLMVKSQPLRVEFSVLTSTGSPAFLSFSGTTNPLQLNQWNHVVGMVDNSAKTLLVAVNGEMSGTLQMGGTVNVDYPQAFSVGNSYPKNLGDYPFVGRIDEVRLSSVLRYNSDFVPTSLLDPDGGTAGLWHFDEVEGATTFADSSGIGNTLNGLGRAATIAGNREVQGSENNFFYSVVRLNTGQTSGPVAIADFNHDGKEDLAVAGVYYITSDKVTIILGMGAGSFGSPVYYSLGQNRGHSSIALDDFNNDGNPDIAVTNFSLSTTSILLGNGDGTFGLPAVHAVGASPSSIALGDFNHDGNLDLAVANRADNTVSILLGTGTGSFAPVATLSVGDGLRSVAAGDFNGDGNIDLAVANSGDSTVSILFGAGLGDFATSLNFTVGTGPSALVVGDFNKDGKLDLATANSSSANISVLLGTGTGSFNSSSTLAVPFGAPGLIDNGDINMDGVLDLVVASSGGVSAFSVLRGDGVGSFGPLVHYSSGSNPLSLAIGDLTGDGKPDLVTGVASASDTVHIYVSR